MSSELTKIEEALRKLQEQPAGTAAEFTAVAPAAAGGRGTQPSVRDGSREIARMAAPDPWSPVQIEKHGLIDFFGPERQTANAFRQLRTSLAQRAAPSNFVLAVTGAGEDSGTSFVARNLAAAFALDPSRTAILVDCDLENQSGSRLAIDSTVPGLVDFLRDDDLGVEQVIQATGIPRLRVIPAGSAVAGAGELYASPRMDDLLGQLKARYPDRFVILDAPPVIDDADGRILSELCDYTLLVIPYAGSSEARVGRAMDIIGPERLIGTIIDNDPGGPE